MKIFTAGNLSEVFIELRSGKTIVFPTETSYGLGCDATNQLAVDKIFKIKGRLSEKPLLVVVSSVAMAKEYVVWNDLLEKIAAKYWPGAVTVVGKAKEKKEKDLARGVVAKDNTLAIRVTAHPLLQSLTGKLGRPLVATSANLADQGDLYDSAEVIRQFKERREQPDIILDYGKLPRRLPTTVVSVVGGILKVIRQGEVKVEQI
ncbi:MAG: threonylcarbamoyl-AMP synthase [Candidatus Magasanikbacteria bacterium]|nr:threonylcarbamoyl-AMP synthase [Candidatus Magasanikbacteria bacterium]